MDARRLNGLGVRVRSLALAVRATALVVLARLLLKRRDASEVLRRLAGGGPGHGPARDVHPDEALVAVRRAGRITGGECLPHSIALAALLQRGGQSPVVVLGCRRYGPQEWGAHAWVEVGGGRYDPLWQPDHAALARLSAAHDWRIGAA